jgi:hypothetical protein
MPYFGTLAVGAGFKSYLLVRSVSEKKLICRFRFQLNIAAEFGLNK